MLLVGVGGQGVLTAARILGDAAHAAGRGVVVGQLHGMSQRGGSVECPVLFGPGRSSYLSRADFVIGFEALEALRAVPRMGQETRVLFNPGRFVSPLLVRLRRQVPAPEEILGEIRGASREVVVVDGPAAMKRTGEGRTLNVFILGALAGLGWLPFDEGTLWDAVARRARPRYLEANRDAFALGLESVAAGVPGRGESEKGCGER